MNASREHLEQSDQRKDTGNPTRLPSPDGLPHFRYLSIDLEVQVRDQCIRALAGVRTDTDESFTWPGNGYNLDLALEELDALGEGADVLLGHNIIAFDLPHLAAANPNLRLLQMPVVDTLRLNPLAFPRNPYHHLVKHYQDGSLVRGRINDPRLDAELTHNLFRDQMPALHSMPAHLLTAWHWLTTLDSGTGFDQVFSWLRDAHRPSFSEATTAIQALLSGNSCHIQVRKAIANETRNGWPLSYALAWLSVAGGNSVMPPWVRYQFPQAGRLVRQLRDTSCTETDCHWCRVRHDADLELRRWFGFPQFRAVPANEDGTPMQRSIVEAAMGGDHVLGILPTGAGKSVCYQVPALSRYDKTGALTVVISPLVALMEDQVKGLESRGIGNCVAVNGLLSMPERSEPWRRFAWEMQPFS